MSSKKIKTGFFVLIFTLLCCLSQATITTNSNITFDHSRTGEILSDTYYQLDLGAVSFLKNTSDDGTYTVPVIIKSGDLFQAYILLLNYTASTFNCIIKNAEPFSSEFLQHLEKKKYHLGCIYC